MRSPRWATRSTTPSRSATSAPITVNRDSVIDSLLGDITASFPATLAPGACARSRCTRTVQAGDPDPLVNTVTATYSAPGSIGHGDGQCQHEPVPARCECHEELHARPDRGRWGRDLHDRRHQHSSADSPNLINGTIVDTLTGNLLDAANTAVAHSNCTAVLPTGGTCTIVTTGRCWPTDPSPLVNTVTVHYNPVGFPNDITDTASDSVVSEAAARR